MNKCKNKCINNDVNIIEENLLSLDYYDLDNKLDPDIKQILDESNAIISALDYEERNDLDDFN